MANIEHIQYVNAPAARVFATLTQEEGLAEIWTKTLSVEAKLGAVNEFRFGDEQPTLMKITELETAKRLMWHCVDSEPEWVGTDVSFDLTEENGKTAVTLKHMNWREVTEYFRSCNYNWAMFLYSLKTYCEAGEGLPYQKRNF
jgi:uncharacterized protein YndB with AHSA1/START domain